MNIDFLQTVKVGDTVRRMLAGVIPCDVVVTKLDDNFIYVGAPDFPATLDPEVGWKFNRTFGYEVDEDLGAGVLDEEGNLTPVVSFLVAPDG